MPVGESPRAAEPPATLGRAPLFAIRKNEDDVVFRGKTAVNHSPHGFQEGGHPGGIVGGTGPKGDTVVMGDQRDRAGWIGPRYFYHNIFHEGSLPRGTGRPVALHVGIQPKTTNLFKNIVFDPIIGGGAGGMRLYSNGPHMFEGANRREFSRGRRRRQGRGRYMLPNGQHDPGKYSNPEQHPEGIHPSISGPPRGRHRAVFDHRLRRGSRCRHVVHNYSLPGDIDENTPGGLPHRNINQ